MHGCSFTISAYVCSYFCDLDLDLDLDLQYEDLDLDSGGKDLDLDLDLNFEDLTTSLANTILISHNSMCSRC